MTTIDTINALFRPLDEAIAETRRITDELAKKGGDEVGENTEEEEK